MFSPRELSFFEKLFNMESGHVLDFSRDGLKNFIRDSVNLDAFTLDYSNHVKKRFRTDSMANTLKYFWETEDFDKTLKLVSDLVDYYEFKDTIYFNNKISNNKINKLYNAKEVYLLDNYYYIYSNDGYFYKVDMNNIKNSIILFKLDNISSFIIRDDNIIITVEDNIYRYDLNNGLLNIINYEEIKYNYNNIFDLYEKN